MIAAAVAAVNIRVVTHSPDERSHQKSTQIDADSTTTAFRLVLSELSYVRHTTAAPGIQETSHLQESVVCCCCVNALFIILLKFETTEYQTLTPCKHPRERVASELGGGYSC